MNSHFNDQLNSDTKHPFSYVTRRNAFKAFSSNSRLYLGYSDGDKSVPKEDTTRFFNAMNEKGANVELIRTSRNKGLPTNFLSSAKAFKRLLGNTDSTSRSTYCIKSCGKWWTHFSILGEYLPFHKNPDLIPFCTDSTTASSSSSVISRLVSSNLKLVSLNMNVRNSTRDRSFDSGMTWLKEKAPRVEIKHHVGKCPKVVSVYFLSVVFVVFGKLEVGLISICHSNL